MSVQPSALARERQLVGNKLPIVEVRNMRGQNIFH